MKFAEHLSAHLTPEWRKQYIQYEKMKEMLYDAADHLSEITREDEYQKTVIEFEEKFFIFCENELKKINSFFDEKLAEATRKHNDLKAEIYAIFPESEGKDEFDIYQFTQSTQSSIKSDTKRRTRKIMKKIGDLKLAYSEFYLNLILLQSYQSLNFTGFRKILKKHDKILNTSAGSEWHPANVTHARFNTCKEVDKLIETTENIFTNVLENGNRSRAMKRLRVPPLNAQQSLWTTFRVGFYSGVLIILIASLLQAISTKDRRLQFNLISKLFRGPFYIWLFVFLIGINVYGWRTCGVNHVLIFELDPRDHISEQHLFEMSLLLAVIWALSLLAYAYAPMIGIDGTLIPLIVVIIYIAFLINPTKTFRHSARFWLIRVIYRVFTSPYFRVEFADFWMADQLNSFATVFSDIVFYLFFYSHYFFTSNPSNTYLPHGTLYTIVKGFINVLPAWFRFIQCIRRYRDDNYRSLMPHAINAGKYSTSFLVITFSTCTELFNFPGDPSSSVFFYLWLTSLIISSIYTYTWDVVMDWGLMNCRSENILLRDELVYPRYTYHLAYVLDFFLRTLWAFSISLNQISKIDSDWLSTIAGFLELLRRFMWNFFRLENEHLNNCGEFRAVRDISIGPISAMEEHKHHTNGVSFGGGPKRSNSKNKRKPNRPKNQYSLRRSGDDSRTGEVSLLMDSKSFKHYDKF